MEWLDCPILSFDTSFPFLDTSLMCFILCSFSLLPFFLHVIIGPCLTMLAEVSFPFLLSISIPGDPSGHEPFRLWMRTKFSTWKTKFFDIRRMNWNFNDLGPWRSCWFCRHFIMIYCWHRSLGLRRRLGCFILFDCIRHVTDPIGHTDRRDGLGGTLDAASNSCVKAHTCWIRKRLSD